MPVIELAYVPRIHAMEIHRGMETHRYGAVVAHRRFGKTVCAVAHLLVKALENRRQVPEPGYGFIAPYRDQAKDLAWAYLMRYSDQIPGCKPMVSELSLTLPTKGVVRLYGADNPEAFRGRYFDGVVLDEHSEMAPNIYSEILRPTLTDYKGWALFMGTPKGKNAFHRIIHGDPETGSLGAKLDPEWYFGEFKASQTGVIDAAELAANRKQMTQDQYDQEYECSFEASVKGAIFAAELAACRAARRTCAVPVDPILPVDTDWDLGVGDSTAIWFSQSVRSGEVRLVDYYESSGEGLPHYAQVLKQKGYVYGQHWAPHDIAVRELGSGRSRIETAATLGIRFQICPDVPLEDGIHAARMLFPRCYFDETKCQAGLEALMHYRRDYNTRLNEFKATPVHDWASHGADAFRYLAVRQQVPKEEAARNRPRPSQPSPTAWMR